MIVSIKDWKKLAGGVRQVNNLDTFDGPRTLLTLFGLDQNGQPAHVEFALVPHRSGDMMPYSATLELDSKQVAQLEGLAVLPAAIREAPADLTLASTKDLVDELINRVDHGCIVLRRDQEFAQHENGMVIRFKGDGDIVNGLLVRAGHILMKDLDKNMRMIDEST